MIEGSFGWVVGCLNIDAPSPPPVYEHHTVPCSLCDLGERQLGGGGFRASPRGDESKVMRREHRPAQEGGPHSRSQGEALQGNQTKPSNAALVVGACLAKR